MSDSERALLALLCLTLAGGADAAAERFRLSPGSVVQNDATGQEGTLGYARGLSYEVMQGYAVAEGDMVLGRVDGSGRLEVPIQRRGLGQASLFDRWPDGIVPYRFHPKLTDIQKRHVQSAIDKLNARTRVELIAADDPVASDYADHVVFEPSGGCASFVGRQLNEDAQSLWVADSCSVGSVMHEIAHAIGLFHEHTRPDRDNYVNVVWDRIIEGKAFNFEIYADGVQIHGEYDYGSIMHYGADFFSRDGNPTIVAPTNVQIGQRLALSADDVRSIDRMYATDLALDVGLHESERGMEIDVSVTNIGGLGAQAPGAAAARRSRTPTGARSASTAAGTAWPTTPSSAASASASSSRPPRASPSSPTRRTSTRTRSPCASNRAPSISTRRTTPSTTRSSANRSPTTRRLLRPLSAAKPADEDDGSSGGTAVASAAPTLGGAVDNDDEHAGSPRRRTAAAAAHLARRGTRARRPTSRSSSRRADRRDRRVGPASRGSARSERRRGRSLPGPEGIERTLDPAPGRIRLD